MPKGSYQQDGEQTTLGSLQQDQNRITEAQGEIKAVQDHIRKEQDALAVEILSIPKRAVTLKMVIGIIVLSLSVELGLDFVRYVSGQPTYTQGIFTKVQPITTEERIFILENRLLEKRERIEQLEKSLGLPNSQWTAPAHQDAE